VADGGGSEERLRDYFKYISTVDAAGVVALFAALGALFGG
jgi:hypothetical protein